MNSRRPILRAGMNFNAGEQARDLRQPARQQEHAVVPQPVIDAVEPDRMQPGIAEQHFQARLGRRIVLDHRWPCLRELAQKQMRHESVDQAGSSSAVGICSAFSRSS